MPQELAKLKGAEVSIVQRGANRKPFLILKSANGEEEIMPEKFIEILKSLTLTPEVEQKIDAEIKKASVPEEAALACKSALRVLTKFKDQIPGELMKALMEAAGYAMPEPKEAAAPVVDEKDKYGMPVKKDGTPDWEKVPEATRPMVQALWKEREDLVKKNDEHEAKIKKAADEAKTAEYIAKAETFKGLSLGAKDLGPIMKTLAEKSPEEFLKLEGVLKAASEAIVKSPLFVENGSTGGGAVNDEPLAKLEALAASRVQKSADKLLTKEQAMDEVLKSAEGRKLYAEYEASRKENQSTK